MDRIEIDGIETVSHILNDLGNNYEAENATSVGNGKGNASMIDNTVTSGNILNLSGINRNVNNFSIGGNADLAVDDDTEPKSELGYFRIDRGSVESLEEIINDEYPHDVDR